jgi:Rrf2 family protein
MANLLRMSNAVSLALHAMVYLARNLERFVPVREIAQAYSVSGNHLAKVCQCLERSGLIRGSRGPCGGFKLAKPPSEITLLDIHTAVEGPIEPNKCLLGKPICGGQCILGGLIESVNHQVLQYLRSTTLAQLSSC